MSGCPRIVRTIKIRPIPWWWTATIPVFFLTLSVAAYGQSSPGCAERAYAQAADASRGWVRGIRDLIVRTRPALRKVATSDMEQQLALYDRRQAQFQYLVHTDASRIHTREGLASLRNWDWTEADARTLRKQSPDYAVLERNVLERQGKAQAEKDWPALHHYVQTSLGKTPQFQLLIKRLQDRENAAEQLLKTCPVAAFGPGAIGAQTYTANAPRSAQELAARYASAHARNTLAIQRLVYWGRAPQRLRASFNSRLADEVCLHGRVSSRPIRSATAMI